MACTAGSRQEELNRLLLEAVDEALASLGESAKHSIYLYLKDTCKLEREEIPDRIDECAYALERLFGIGASFLELRIMRSFYAKTGCLVECCEPGEFSLVTYVNMVKVSFLLDAQKGKGSSASKGVHAGDAEALK